MGGLPKQWYLLNTTKPSGEHDGKAPKLWKHNHGVSVIATMQRVTTQIRRSGGCYRIGNAASTECYNFSHGFYIRNVWGIEKPCQGGMGKVKLKGKN